MIKSISIEDINTLKVLNPNFEMNIKAKSLIYVKGYYNNDKLLGYCIYLKKDEYSTKVQVIDFYYSNNISCIKMLLLLHGEFLNNKIEMSLELYEHIRKYNNLYICAVENKNKVCVTIKMINNNLDLCIYSLSHKYKQLIEFYYKLSESYSVNEIYLRKEFMIKSFFKHNLMRLSTLDKDDVIRIVTKKKKKLFNGGEKQYIKVLKKEGFIKTKTATYFKDNYKQYSLEYNNNAATLTTYVVKEYNVKNFKYRHNFSFYRKILNYISENNKSFYLLNENYVPHFFHQFNIYENHTYILNNIMKNGFFINDIKLICKKNSINYTSTKYSNINKLLITLKRQIGKEETISFIKNIIYRNNITRKYNTLDQLVNKNYYTIIMSKYLTRKALIQLISNDKLDTSQILAMLNKFNDVGCYFDRKVIRKEVSSYIKKNLCLNDLYYKYVNAYILATIPDISDELKDELLDLIGDLDNCSHIEFWDMLNIMKFIGTAQKRIGKLQTYLIIKKIHKDFLHEKDKSIFYHDKFVIYYFELIKNEYLTNKALETILFKPFSSVQSTTKYLLRISDFSKEFLNGSINKRKVRTHISSCIRKDKSLKEYYEYMTNNLVEIYFPNIEERDKSNINKLLNEMNKYESVTIEDLISIFKDKTLDIANQEIPSIFKEYSIDNRKDRISKLVIAALGSKNKKGILSNPKSLYGDLRKLYDVNKIVQGDFPITICKDILKCLKSRGLDIPEDILYWCKIEKKCSAEYLMAGDITECCMNFGTAKATTYALEEGFGIINIYNDNDIVANSVIWIQDDLNYLVIDNIECIHSNINLDCIKKEYYKLIQYIVKEYNLKEVVQGHSYNDLELFNRKRDKKIPLKLKAKKVNMSFYSDADFVYNIQINEKIA